MINEYHIFHGSFNEIRKVTWWGVIARNIGGGWCCYVLCSQTNVLKIHKHHQFHLDFVKIDENIHRMILGRQYILYQFSQPLVTILSTGILPTTGNVSDVHLQRTSSGRCLCARDLTWVPTWWTRSLTSLTQTETDISVTWSLSPSWRIDFIADLG